MDEQKDATESAMDLPAVIAAVAWMKGLVERWRERLLRGERTAEDGRTPMQKAVDREFLAENKQSQLLDRLLAADKLVGDTSDLTVMKAFMAWSKTLDRANRENDPEAAARVWKLAADIAGGLSELLDQREGRLRQMAGEDVRLNPLSGTWFPGSWGDESEEAAESGDDDLFFEGQLPWMLANTNKEAAADGGAESVDWKGAAAELLQRIDRMVIRGDGTAEDFPVNAVLALRSIFTANDREAMTEYERVWLRLCYVDGRLSATDESAIEQVERQIRIAAEEIGRELPDSMPDREWRLKATSVLAADIRAMMRVRLVELEKSLVARMPNSRGSQQQSVVDLQPSLAPETVPAESVPPAPPPPVEAPYLDLTFDERTAEIRRAGHPTPRPVVLSAHKEFAAFRAMFAAAENGVSEEVIRHQTNTQAESTRTLRYNISKHLRPLGICVKQRAWILAEPNVIPNVTPKSRKPKKTKKPSGKRVSNKGRSQR